MGLSLKGGAEWQGHCGWTRLPNRHNGRRNPLSERIADCRFRNLRSTRIYFPLRQGGVKTQSTLSSSPATGTPHNDKSNNSKNASACRYQDYLRLGKTSCRDNNSDVDIGTPDVSYDNLAGEDLGEQCLVP